MQRRQVNKNVIFLIFIVTSFVLLTLSLVNINRFTSSSKVLGVTVNEDPAQIFWTEFLAKNPNYIPGWLEMERPDIANGIDPNYERLE